MKNAKSGSSGHQPLAHRVSALSSRDRTSQSTTDGQITTSTTMTKRALVMSLKAVAVAVSVLGIPLIMLCPAFIWQYFQTRLEREAQTLARVIDRDPYTPAHGLSVLESVVGENGVSKHILIHMPDGLEYEVGVSQHTPYMSAQTVSLNGAHVMIDASAWSVIALIAGAVALIVAMATGAGLGAWVLARREARRLAAPLIYLAAQAEQMGAGNIQPHVLPSGIEEIDLVQDELIRANERLAGRILKERQFAADASHQLRTPLTALSMRIEEIQLLSDNQEICDEAEECLEQIDRLTHTIDTLLTSSRNSVNPHTQAVRLHDILLQQHHEWEHLFSQADRTLTYDNPDDRIAIATPGSLSQALATLIENALRYGKGEVKVMVKPASTTRNVIIQVCDEGESITDEEALHLFERGYSGHQSSGIGLALAKNLVEADGGDLALTSRQPTCFTITVRALPSSAQHSYLRQGGLVAIGRRGRRF